MKLKENLTSATKLSSNLLDHTPQAHYLVPELQMDVPFNSLLPLQRTRRAKPVKNTSINNFVCPVKLFGGVLLAIGTIRAHTIINNTKEVSVINTEVRTLSTLEVAQVFGGSIRGIKFNGSLNANGYVHTSNHQHGFSAFINNNGISFEENSGSLGDTVIELIISFFYGLFT